MIENVPKVQIEKFEENSSLTYVELAEKLGVTYYDVVDSAKILGIYDKSNRYYMDEVDDVAKSLAKSHYKFIVNALLGYHIKTTTEYEIRIDHPGNASRTCQRCGYIPYDLISSRKSYTPTILATDIPAYCIWCKELMDKTSKLAPPMSITKSFVFDASHYLPNHPKKCQFLHGHTYHMDITFKAPIDLETGVVSDFGKVKQKVNAAVVDVLDHNFINDLMTCLPTAENMVLWVWAMLSIYQVKHIEKIRIYETETSYAEMNKKDVNDFVFSYWKEFHEDFDITDDGDLIEFKSKIEELKNIRTSKIEQGYLS